jgi:hypothetical protein
MPDEIEIHLVRGALAHEMNRELMPVPGHSSARYTRKEVEAKRLHIRAGALIDSRNELILILNMAGNASGSPSM